MPVSQHYTKKMGRRPEWVLEDLWEPKTTWDEAGGHLFWMAKKIQPDGKEQGWVTSSRRQWNLHDACLRDTPGWGRHPPRMVARDTVFLRNCSLRRDLNSSVPGLGWVTSSADLEQWYPIKLSTIPKHCTRWTWRRMESTRNETILLLSVWMKPTHEYTWVNCL